MFIIRWILLKQKKLKWRLAFWQYFDTIMTQITENPQKLKEAILPYLAEVINKTATKEDENIAES